MYLDVFMSFFTYSGMISRSVSFSKFDHKNHLVLIQSCLLFFKLLIRFHSQNVHSYSIQTQKLIFDWTNEAMCGISRLSLKYWEKMIIHSNEIIFKNEEFLLRLHRMCEILALIYLCSHVATAIHQINLQDENKYSKKCIPVLMACFF